MQLHQSVDSEMLELDSLVMSAFILSIVISLTFDAIKTYPGNFYIYIMLHVNFIYKYAYYWFMCVTEHSNQTGR